MERDTTIRAYLDYLEQHGRRPNTVSTYRDCLRASAHILEGAGLSIDPAKGSVETYMTLRTAPSLADTSRRGYATMYSLYVRWATGRDLAKEADVHWARPQPLTRRWISDDQYRVLWDAADTRIRVVLALGAWIGFRRFEISMARWTDIHEGNRIFVYGKGSGPDGKVVSLRMPPAVIKALDAWRAECPGNAEYIICTPKGKGVNADTIGRYVHELGKDVGINVSTHSLRRLFACDLDAREISPVQIAQLMRHESIETTYTCYLRPNPDRLEEIMDGVGAGF